MTKLLADMNSVELIEQLYMSLAQDNLGLNEILTDLARALRAEKLKEAVLTKPLALNNREGRKRLKAYAKKFNVNIKYDAPADSQPE